MKKKSNTLRLVIAGLGICLIAGIGMMSVNAYQRMQYASYTNEPLQPLTNEQKIQDFEFLYKTIVENYPFLEVNKRITGVDWVANKELYLERIQKAHFESVLGAIIGDLNNKHTALLDEYWTELYRNVYGESKEAGYWSGMYFDVLNHPKVIQRYNLGTYKEQEMDKVKENHQQYSSNASVKDIIEGKVASIQIPSLSITESQFQEDQGLIKAYLTKVKDYQAIVIDIRGNTGGSTNYWMNFLLPQIISTDYEVVHYSFFKDGDITKGYFKAKDLNPLKVKNLDKLALPNLPSEVREEFSYYTPINLKVAPADDSIKFKGKVYLLVDESVYSSAEMLATFAKESELATLIGSKTAGDGIGSDPAFFMLPNSGYVIRMSKELGTTSDGTCNEEHKTTPDYIVEDTSRTENPLEDQCIQKVLELEDLTPLIN